jgi:hypothetical protein
MTPTETRVSNLCEGCRECEGFDEWELGPDDGSFLCHDCVNKLHPLKSIPQEWEDESYDPPYYGPESFRMEH